MPSGLALLHELVPKAVRVAVLLNPSVPTAVETTLQQVQEAARAIGLQLQVLYASTSREIDAAFATFGRERPDALFVDGGAFFFSRRVQLANLAARERIPTAHTAREYVAAGGLISYGTNLADSFHHVGLYTGQILKGTKPADLPVVQSAKSSLRVQPSARKSSVACLRRFHYFRHERFFYVAASPRRKQNTRRHKKTSAINAFPPLLW
jgi:putative ABC transport system substrate-binding protein